MVQADGGDFGRIQMVVLVTSSPYYIEKEVAAGARVLRGDDFDTEYRILIPSYSASNYSIRSIFM
jgi:hypothetical protein